jgi:hypothetical protein
VTRPLVLALALAAASPHAALGAETRPPAPRPVTGAGQHVGPETCKACHPAAYEVWRVGPHARALEALPVQHRKDPRCLSCHSPDAEDGLAAVTCEACHGPGRVYAAPYVMRDPELSRLVGLVDPGEKSCVACHGDSTPSLVKFEYLKKLPVIDHWTRERAARAAERPGATPAKGK